MIGQFDFSEKGWVSGKGRTAKWREIPFDQKAIEPQYLMAQSTYLESEKAVRGYKVAFMDVTSATNARTMIATVLSGVPCGNKVPVLQPGSRSNLSSCLTLAAVLNSFAYDFVIRRRCGGLTLNWFIIEATPLPRIDDMRVRAFLEIQATRLALVYRMFSGEWLRLRNANLAMAEKPWTSHWAITASERLRTRCTIEAVVAELYGLSLEDMQFILTIDESDPIGFWRVDQDLPVEHRLTSLALKAFEHLKQVGLDEFCQQGWELPRLRPHLRPPPASSPGRRLRTGPTANATPEISSATRASPASWPTFLLKILSGQHNRSLTSLSHLQLTAPAPPVPNGASSRVIQLSSAIRWRTYQAERRGSVLEDVCLCS